MNMTTSPVRLTIVSGILLVVLGLAVVIVKAQQYLERPYAIDSNSGRSVFMVNGALVAYDDFSAGVGPTIVGLGVAVLVAGLFAGAITWRGRRHSSSL